MKGLAVIALPLLISASPPGQVGTLIANVSIIDGTGAQSVSGSVRIVNGRIACVGACLAQQGDQRVDGQGLALAPGFIDTHSHHDIGLARAPDAVAATSQGITTIVIGQDGSGASSLSGNFSDFVDLPVGVNIASYIGHGAIRAKVMGSDSRRAAREDEIVRMERLVERAMKQGALGLSTGLEYEPAIYSTREELLRLAHVAARYGGGYISHIRSEDVALDQALEELIEIGRQTGMPVQASHLKIAMVDKWGGAPALLARLNEARALGVDVTADVYPYTWWQSGLDVLLPARDFNDIEAARFALAHLAKPEDLVLSNFPPDPSLVGKSILNIATMLGASPEETLLALNREAQKEGRGSSVLGRSMYEDDVIAFAAWPHANFSSDGMLEDLHPRGAGAFPRVFNWLVRDKKVLTLEQVVHKMTGLSARHMGIADRGSITPGMAADLVLFDPQTIADQSTFASPASRPVGIRAVWVNGVVVMCENTPTGQRPGHLIRRSGPIQQAQGHSQSVDALTSRCFSNDVQ